MRRFQSDRHHHAQFASDMCRAFQFLANHAQRIFYVLPFSLISFPPCFPSRIITLPDRRVNVKTMQLRNHRPANRLLRLPCPASMPYHTVYQGKMSLDIGSSPPITTPSLLNKASPNPERLNNHGRRSARLRCILATEAGKVPILQPH